MRQEAVAGSNQSRGAVLGKKHPDWKKYPDYHSGHQRDPQFLELVDCFGVCFVPFLVIMVSFGIRAWLDLVPTRSNLGLACTITREPTASTSKPMDNNATNVILAYLDTMSRDLTMANKRLDRMVSQREQVGFPDTRQEKGRSSCKLRGKNVIRYTPMNLECCVVSSRSQVGVVTALPRVEVLESPFCDTLGIVRSHEDQTLIVGTQALVVPLDDKIDSLRENDLCLSSASTYNLTKVPLPSDESIHTLVDPCENQGGSTLVNELPTTSEVVDNDQSGKTDLGVLDCLGNPNCDFLGKDGFECDPFAAHDSLCLCGDYFLEREGVAFLEIPSTSSLCVSYVKPTSAVGLETSEYMHKEIIVGVDLCDTFLYPLCAHDIFHRDIEGMPNFEDNTLGESESVRDLSPWLLYPFDPETILGWERITLSLFPSCLNAWTSHFLCNICTNLFMLKTKDPWLHFKFVSPRHGMLI
ncbi:hypothetical protein FXO37_13556 [Capsicum annuum]|nr:hypothetical protein FXO37_13556 [Capsicum annuum]